MGAARTRRRDLAGARRANSSRSIPLDTRAPAGAAEHMLGVRATAEEFASAPHTAGLSRRSKRLLTGRAPNEIVQMPEHGDAARRGRPPSTCVLMELL